MYRRRPFSPALERIFEGKQEKPLNDLPNTLNGIFCVIPGEK
jgi:hypothetical protein